MTDSFNKVNIKLILNKIMILVDEPETMTSAGIYIPDTADKPKNTGVVVARGENCVSSIAEGDRIIFAQNAGEEVTHNNEKYLVLREDNVHGKIQ